MNSPDEIRKLASAQINGGRDSHKVGCPCDRCVLARAALDSLHYAEENERLRAMQSALIDEAEAAMDSGAKRQVKACRFGITTSGMGLVHPCDLAKYREAWEELEPLLVRLEEIMSADEEDIREQERISARLVFALNDIRARLAGEKVGG